jgi:hypothetical protein
VPEYCYRGPPIVERYTPAMGSSFLPPSPAYSREPLRRDIQHRPRREIVYFDDHGESVYRSAHFDSLRYESHIPALRQPIASRETSHSTSVQRRPGPEYSPQHEASRQLPFRLMNAEHGRDPEHDDRHPRDVLGTVSGSRELPAHTDESPGVEDNSTTAADNFLRTVDVVATSGKSVSMSRTASAQQRSVLDNEGGSVASARFSQSGTPGRLRQDLADRLSQVGTRDDSSVHSHTPHYGHRTVSRNSGVAASEASDAYRRRDLAPIVRPRTPPSNLLSYGASHSSAEMQAVNSYDVGPPIMRHEHLEPRHGHYDVAVDYDYGRQGYSSEDQYSCQSRYPARYVEVRGHELQEAPGELVGPVAAGYELSRHGQRDPAYSGIVPRGQFRESQLDPRPYQANDARSRPPERRPL